MPVADTLLRLAEEPAFYTPKWSQPVLTELENTLEKFGYDALQIKRRVDVMLQAFPDAMVIGFDDLISAMKNHEGDRHVLAAAVRCGADAIVSNNKKHFPPDALSPYGIECLTAGQFLSHQYHLNPDRFIAILEMQAEDISWTLQQLISKHVPELSKLIVTEN